MWARVIEFMLAIWLAISPFTLRYPDDEPFLWMNHLICGYFVALFAILSFWHPLRKIHLLTLGIVFWLWSFGYSTFPGPTTPATENSVVLAILLFMLAIIPTHAEQPSYSWQIYVKSLKRDDRER